MMAHQESVTATSLRTPRAAAAAGIVFSLLFSLALVLLLLLAPSDTATEGAWLTDTSHRATVAVALNLVPFGGIAFLWFIGVVRNRIGPREDRFFASLFLISYTAGFGSGSDRANQIGPMSCPIRSGLKNVSS